MTCADRPRHKVLGEGRQWDGSGRGPQHRAPALAEGRHLLLGCLTSLFLAVSEWEEGRPIVQSGDEFKLRLITCYLVE